MTTLGADLAHFQTITSWPQIKASGRSFVALKATEGTTYVDPTFAARRQAAHAAGLIVGIYHFARAGNVAAEAGWFLKTIGTLQPGEFLVLDQEVPNTVAWCKAWLDTVYNATGVRPFIYMNQGSATGVTMGDWTSVAADYALWLARYDNAPDTFNAVPYWGQPAMKQYSDAGVVLGVAGTCDVDSFNGTEAQLLKFGKGGSPAPTVQEDEMRIIQNATRGIAVVGPGYYHGLAPSELSAASALYGSPVVFTDPAQFDLAVNVATGGDPIIGVLGKLAGVTYRIERIDEGKHGDTPDPWGYGNRIQDTQTKVTALGQAPTVDAQQVAALVLAGIKAQMAADVTPPASS